MLSAYSVSIHHICRGHGGHCPWSKNVQFCSTWNLLMVMWNKFASHNKQSCSTWQNCLSCGVILACVSMTNCSLYQILIHVTNLQCMLSCRDLRCFDAKSILSRFTHFSVEQKLTHKSCPWSTNDKYDVWVWVYSEKRDPGQGTSSPPAYTLEAPNNSSRLHPSFPDAHTKRGCLRRKRGRQCWLAIVLDLTWLNLTSITDTHCG